MVAGAAADYLRVDPGLLEEATFHALRASPEAPAYHRQRERLYAIGDPEERDRRFRMLHASWFVRLSLDRPIRQALDEQAAVLAATSACLMGRAASPREEGADLHVLSTDSEAGRSATLVLRLRPESLSDPEGLLTLLRHELQHVADMLDPSFGYQPRLEVSEPARRRVVLERYAVLWNVSVDGRLERRGLAPEGAEARRGREFSSAFAMLGEDGGSLFKRFWSHPAPTHAELARAASDPEGSLTDPAATGRAGDCAESHARR